MVFLTDFVRGSSSYTRIEVHIAFVIKYRHKVFDDAEFQGRCKQLLYQAAAKNHIIIVEMGFDRDHVHMIIILRCDQSLSLVAKVLKGTTGRKLLQEFPLIKQRYFWGSGLWAKSVFGDSLGRSPDQMVEYVRNQGRQRAATKTKSLTDFFTAIPPVYSERTN